MLKHLNRDAIEPLVAVPAKGIFESRFKELGIKVMVLPGMPERTSEMRFKRRSRVTAVASYALNLWDSLTLVPRLARLITNEKAQLVYCNNMMVKSTGALAAQLAGVPCVLHARNLHEAFGKVLFYCKGIARLGSVRTVISNSHASAIPYMRSVPGKMQVVHNGIDLEDYQTTKIPKGQWRAEYGFGQDDFLVGFTGNLIPRKGLDTLIRAAALALEQQPSLTFVIVGRVPVGSRTDHSAGYKALAAQLGIADKVRFIGFLDDVRPAVKDFDILALPSLQEPFGRSIIEAMALGTPVVASRVGGIPEIIDDGSDGLLATPGDPEALAGAICRMAEDAVLRSGISAAAADKVASQFNVARLNRKMEELLLQAAGRPRSEER